MTLCKYCGLDVDEKVHKCVVTYKCDKCSGRYKILDNFQKHIRKCAEEPNPMLLHHNRFKLLKSAFDGILAVYYLADISFLDIQSLYTSENENFKSLLSSLLKQLECIKFRMGCWIEVERPGKDSDEKDKKIMYIFSAMKELCSIDKIDTTLLETKEELDAWIDQLTHEGSGWTIKSIKSLEIRIAKFVPHHGGCANCKLPPNISNKKAILNINTNTDCFMYSILAGLYPQSKNGNRSAIYNKYIGDYDFSMVRGCVPLNSIRKFEKRNNISVNIYSLCINKKTVIPLQVNEQTKQKHVNLLLFNDHYFFIKSFNRLLNRSGYKAKRCLRCLSGFPNEQKLKLHESYCLTKSPQKVTLPKEGEKIKFQSHEKMFRNPFVVYADFETLASKIDHHITATSFEYQEHNICSFGLDIVDWQGKVLTKSFYRGSDAASHFIQSLITLKFDLNELYWKAEKPLSMNNEQETIFFLSQVCHICKENFTDDDLKVRDHDHLTGEFRGAAHQACNLKWKWNYKIPIVFHNLKNFDAHLIISALQKEMFKRITFIPQTIEKYIGFSMDQFTFIDSFAFLPASLDSLAGNLTKEDKQCFITQIMGERDHSLLLEKASLPYEYLDTWEKFEDKCLPPIEAFDSTLTGKKITEEVYSRLQRIWIDYGCKNLGDFHDIYLQLDVALLTSIFENFRNMSLREFELDPTHFWSTPGLTWAAAMKFTGAEIDHMHDIDMVLMLEKGIRGGISSAMKRHAIANNPLCPGYDKEKPNTYITYLDVNNLYGYSLIQNLPYKSFTWVDESDHQAVLNEITSNRTKNGYILEVDLDYPKELHDWHDDYPLAPETIAIKEEQLSRYQTKLIEKLESCGNKRVVSPKLIPNLYNKIQYVTHYQNLRYYMSKGLLLKKIHRILQFEEKPWLQPYIILCTEKRKQATNAFEKDFWKLMINSLYGKSIENKRKHCEVKFLADRSAVIKATRKPLFDQFCILDENRAIAKLRKSKVVLDKPISIGFSVLEFAKLYMYRLHYDTFKAHYGRNLSLVYTDTDSFIYHIQTENLYRDFEYFKSIMDFCDYPENHFLHNNENKKKLGYLKDETNGDPIIEIIALKSKMYLIRSVNSERKTAKGIQKQVVKAQLLQNNYRDCLYKEELYKHTNHRLQSKNHVIKAIATEKISLSPLDDKRWAIDNVNTHAFGHYETTNQI